MEISKRFLDFGWRSNDIGNSGNKQKIFWVWVRKVYLGYRGYQNYLRTPPQAKKALPQANPKQSCLHPKQICVSSSPPSTWLLTPSKISTLLGSVRQGCKYLVNKSTKLAITEIEVISTLFIKNKIWKAPNNLFSFQGLLKLDLSKNNIVSVHEHSFRSLESNCVLEMFSSNMLCSCEFIQMLKSLNLKWVLVDCRWVGDIVTYFSW